MRVFVSSVVGGFEEMRAAARRAIETLDYTPVMSEDFGARPYSPERSCLTDIESSDALLLILGERFGFEPEAGVSVTMQEFHHAATLGLPILVFVQRVGMEPKQDMFRREVSEYKAGLTRESFETADELQEKIIRNLHRLGRKQDAISTERFAKRVAVASKDSDNSYAYANPKFVFAFFPQPERAIDLAQRAARRDMVFSNLAAAGLLKLADGYEEIDRADHTGIRTRKLSLRQYEDGLVLLNAEATVDAPHYPFAAHLVPPSNLMRLVRGCFALIEANGGWCRVGLMHMDSARMEEIPQHSSNSFAMPMRSATEAYEDALHIPLTEERYLEWGSSVIAKLQRRLSYE